MHGLNMYDYSARWKADWYFTTVDPLAEKYYSISPYVYVANNPIKAIDPTGMDSINVNKQEVDVNSFKFRFFYGLYRLYNRIKKDHGEVYGKPINQALGKSGDDPDENWETALDFHATVFATYTMAQGMGKMSFKSGKNKPKTKVPKSGSLTIERGVFSESERNAAKYMT